MVSENQTTKSYAGVWHDPGTLYSMLISFLFVLFLNKGTGPKVWNGLLESSFQTVLKVFRRENLRLAGKT